MDWLRGTGHADILRRSIDGAVGVREGTTGLPLQADAAVWKRHYDKLEGIARNR